LQKNHGVVFFIQQDALDALSTSLVAILTQSPIAIYIGYIHYLARATMSTSTVFTNNRSQAVRLPADMRLPENIKRVTVRARGSERIIAPLHESWDSFFFDTPAVSDDFLVERADQSQSERETL
jgi:antitoxin VapB